jgi:hypothetical protein
MGDLILTAVVFALLAVVGWLLANSSPVANDGAAPPHVPAACLVTARRTFRFPAAPRVAWNRFIGFTLLAIGGGACALIFFVAAVGA